MNTITIHCIALDGDGAQTGVDWYWLHEVRERKLGFTGAEIEAPFELQVPAGATYEEITQAADEAAWNKTYLKETQ